MTPRPFKSLFIFAAFGIFQTSSAVPSVQVVEVIPGPGLPSLKDLGITSTDLYKPDYLESRGLSIPNPPKMAQPAGNAVTGSPKDNAATRAAQYTANCVYNNFPATRSDAIACRNYLITAGNSYCDVPADDEYAVLCTSGNSEILGWNYYNVSGALLAYCSDTAVGASWVIDQCSTCTADNCAVEGSQTASGSDVYVVYIGQSV